MAEPSGKGGPSPAFRATLAAIGAGIFYFLLLSGGIADPMLWGNKLPPNDAATLDAQRKGFSEDIHRKLLDEHLRLLEEGDVRVAARKISEFTKLFPVMRPTLAGALLRRAERALGAKDLEVAKLLVEAAINLDPEDPRPLALQLEVRRAAGETDLAEAQKSYAARKARYPEPKPQHLAIGILGPLLSAALIWLASGAARKASPPPSPRLSAALAALAAAEEPVDQSGTGDRRIITKVLSAEDRLEQAKLLVEEGAWDAALPIFRKAVQLNPAVTKKVTGLCLAAGKTLYDRQNLEHAQQAFQLAVEYDPDEVRAQTYLGHCYAKGGDFAAAVDPYLHVCSITPDDPVGFYNLGICYEKSGQSDQAQKAFERSLQLKPDLAQAHYYMARLAEATKDKPQAINHWRMVRDRMPGTPQAMRANERLAALGG